MILLIGLGNPGKEYLETRHNVGFWFIDQIAKTQSVPSFQKKFNSEFSNITIDFIKVGLLKPQTYMNNSGKAVSAAVQFYKIPLDSVIVVHDDLDLPVGKVKIKQGGSSGGHNGIKSIDSMIGQDYWRVRIGIGHPERKEEVSGYVLSKMEENDKIKIGKAIDFLVQNLDKLSQKGFSSLQEDLGKTII